MRLKDVYDTIGGADTLTCLVDAFYVKVQAHENLSPLFPENIMYVRNKQYKFLTQFFGGPTLYSDIYGSPMIREKHIFHTITPMRAREWLECMSSAMCDIGLQEEVRNFMLERLTVVANQMVNAED